MSTPVNDGAGPRDSQQPRLTTADMAAVGQNQTPQREAPRDRIQREQREQREAAGDQDAASSRGDQDVASGREGVQERERPDKPGGEDKQLAPLFAAAVTQDYRARWDIVQRGFVDDPRQAVRQGDELVAQVMKNLAESFSNERSTLDGQLDRTDNASTEALRVALRRYRSFFERLLSI